MWFLEVLSERCAMFTLERCCGTFEQARKQEKLVWVELMFPTHHFQHVDSLLRHSQFLSCQPQAVPWINPEVPAPHPQVNLPAQETTPTSIRATPVASWSVMTQIYPKSKTAIKKSLAVHIVSSYHFPSLTWQWWCPSKESLCNVVVLGYRNDTFHELRRLTIIMITCNWW